MFNKAFNDLAKHPELDFAPEDLEKAMEEVDELVYPNINDVSWLQDTCLLPEHVCIAPITAHLCQ
jgi:hypothetical protein